VVLGGETVMKGLIPPLFISVAPRGIAVPVRFDPGIDPGVDNGDAVPLEDSVGEVQFVLLVVEPPPSKVEVVPLMLEVDPPPLNVELMPELVLVDEQFALEAGLKPPGSISVAPKGTPVPPLEIEPGMPSGDVAPSPGVPITLCAWLAPQLNKMAAAITHAFRIVDSSCGGCRAPSRRGVS
jgi:hypothetical protein